MTLPQRKFSAWFDRTLNIFGGHGFLVLDNRSAVVSILLC